MLEGVGIFRDPIGKTLIKHGKTVIKTCVSSCCFINLYTKSLGSEGPGIQVLLRRNSTSSVIKQHKIIPKTHKQLHW